MTNVTTQALVIAANQLVASAGPPPPHVIKVLEKMAKGLKGSLGLHLLEEAVEFLPGEWKVTPSTGAVKWTAMVTDRKTWDMTMKDLVGPVTPNFFSALGAEDYNTLEFKDAASAAAGVAHIRQNSTRVTTKKGPENTEVGHYYIFDLQYPSKPKMSYATRWDDVPAETVCQYKSLWIGVRAYTFTKDSVSFVALAKAGARVDDDGEVTGKMWTWLYAQGVKESAQQVLDTVDQGDRNKALRPSQTRTTEGTGTCPVCFRNMKFVTGTQKMTLHGYSRPGHGYITGSCFGVRRDPFELSPEGTKLYVEELKKFKAQEEKRLAFLSKNEPEFVTDRLGRKVGRDDPMYQMKYKDELRKYESTIRMVETDIKHYREKVASWTLKPLPR